MADLIACGSSSSRKYINTATSISATGRARSRAAASTGSARICGGSRRSAWMNAISLASSLARAHHPDVPYEQARQSRAPRNGRRCRAPQGTVAAAVRRLCHHGDCRSCYVHCDSVGRYGEGRMPTGSSGTRLPARGARATASARGRHIREASDPQPGLGWSSRLARRRWAAAGVAVAVLALCAAGTIVMLPQPARKAPARVAVCGLVPCDFLPRGTAATRATASLPARTRRLPRCRHRPHRLPRHRSRPSGPRPRHGRRAGTRSSRRDGARLACGEACGGRAPAGCLVPGRNPGVRRQPRARGPSKIRSRAHGSGGGGSAIRLAARPTCRCRPCPRLVRANASFLVGRVP